MNFNSKTLNKVYFLFFIVLIILGMFLGYFKLYGEIQADEIAYKTISDNFNYDYLTNYTDTKPIFFLAIEKALGADIIKTRILNILLVVIISCLLYSLTKNKTAFLFVLIPIALTSMWLTVEIIEVVFILLSFKYQDNAGWFIGFATVIRPYSALYFIILDKKQKIQFTIVGIIAISILVYFGLFWSYASRLLSYGTGRIYDEFGLAEPMFLILFLIIGLSSYQMGKTKLWHWQILSLTPLYLKVYGHYFMTPISLLFLGYLINQKEDKK